MKKSAKPTTPITKGRGLKKRYFWGSGLFSDGCYYGSAGTVSSATIQKYIENQKTAL